MLEHSNRSVLPDGRKHWLQNDGRTVQRARLASDAFLSCVEIFLIGRGDGGGGGNWIRVP